MLTGLDLTTDANSPHVSVSLLFYSFPLFWLLLFCIYLPLYTASSFSVLLTFFVCLVLCLPPSVTIISPSLPFPPLTYSTYVFVFPAIQYELLLTVIIGDSGNSFFLFPSSNKCVSAGDETMWDVTDPIGKVIRRFRNSKHKFTTSMASTPREGVIRKK